MERRTAIGYTADTMSAEKFLIVWLLGLIVVGAAVLSLPFMTVAGGLAPIDALFTATSSVCITGLMVMSAKTDFTLAGQITILVLFQCGGIGIVTVASGLILSAERRLPLDYEEAVTSTVTTSRFGSFRNVAQAVIVATFTIEAIGAGLLFVAWPATGPDGAIPWDERLWLAVFHAVSGFCNAGITLMTDSLAMFRSDVAVQVIFMGLIIAGGFGFINLSEILFHLRTRSLRWSKFSLSLKVAIVLTVGFNVVAALLLLALERGVALGDLGNVDAIVAAMFHAVTTRSSGFETIALANFTEVSLILMMILMFIGAASGSCGGGVRLGTVAILFALVRSYIRNDTEPVLMGRRITRTDQRKAVVLVTASVPLCIAGACVLYLVEAGPLVLADSRSEMLEFGFEVMSALGTVGLSTGITPELSAHGKAIIIVLMIVGRLGPLAVIASWARRPIPRPFTSPEESLPVG